MLRAARTQFSPGVHDAPVTSSAPRGRVDGVAVGDVDLVVASAALDYVPVAGVSVGEHEVVAALHDYLIVGPVARDLVDTVVVAGPVAGRGVTANQLVRRACHRGEHGHQHHHQGRHHHQLAHKSSPILAGTPRGLMSLSYNISSTLTTSSSSAQPPNGPIPEK